MPPNDTRPPATIPARPSDDPPADKPIAESSELAFVDTPSAFNAPADLRFASNNPNTTPTSNTAATTSKIRRFPRRFASGVSVGTRRACRKPDPASPLLLMISPSSSSPEPGDAFLCKIVVPVADPVFAALAGTD